MDPGGIINDLGVATIDPYDNIALADGLIDDTSKIITDSKMAIEVLLRAVAVIAYHESGDLSWNHILDGLITDLENYFYDEADYVAALSECSRNGPACNPCPESNHESGSEFHHESDPEYGSDDEDYLLDDEESDPDDPDDYDASYIEHFDEEYIDDIYLDLPCECGNRCRHCRDIIRDRLDDDIESISLDDELMEELIDSLDEQTLTRIINRVFGRSDRKTFRHDDHDDSDDDIDYSDDVDYLDDIDAADGCSGNESLPELFDRFIGMIVKANIRRLDDADEREAQERKHLILESLLEEYEIPDSDDTITRYEYDGTNVIARKVVRE